MSRKNDNFFSIASFLCSMMVVGIHCYGAGKADSLSVTARIEGFFSHGIFTAAVPIFFVISGYLFFLNVSSQREVRNKQIRRIYSLAVPFLAWSGSYYLFYGVAAKYIAGMSTVAELSVWGAIKGILFYEYVFPMWFMFQLMIYVILAPVLFEILKQPRVSICFVIGMAILGALGLEVNVNVGGLVRSIFMPNMFCYYFLGCMGAKYKGAFTTIGQRVMKFPTYSLIAGGILWE